MDHLAVDLYAGDGVKDLTKLVADPAYSLLALKLTQGNYYSGGDWALRMWASARSVAGDRYGKTWFRVAYHYLDVAVDGVVQANFFLSRLKAVGGMGYGDPFVMMDVERANQKATATRAQVIACAKAFRDRVHEVTGLIVVVYGGQYLRELGIKIAEFGCEYAWVADYEAKLRPTHYTDLGVDVAHLLGWQYGGVDGKGQEEVFLVGYPHTSPVGNVDLSAITLAGGGAAAIAMLASWCISGGAVATRALAGWKR